MKKKDREEVELARGLIKAGTKGNWNQRWIEICIRIIDSQERKIKRLEKK